MVPQVAEISSIFDQIANPWKDGGAGIDGILSHIEATAAPDITFHIVGQGFQLANDLNGIQEIKDYFKGSMAPAFLSGLDTTMAMNHEVVRVIGGGNSHWFAIELKGTGTSKKADKPYVSEAILVLRTNDQGKWVEVRVYMDTLQIQNHILQASK
ncbi:hypothetical protein AAE478_003653 [Parahypoxylon ruwenzoriense]